MNGLHFPAAIRSLRGILPRDRPLLVQDHASRVPRSACARTAWRLGLREADGFLFAARALADPWRGARVIAIRQPVYEVMEAGTSLPNPFEPRPSEADRLPGEPVMLWVGRLNRNKDPLTRRLPPSSPLAAACGVDARFSRSLVIARGPRVPAGQTRRCRARSCDRPGVTENTHGHVRRS